MSSRNARAEVRPRAAEVASGDVLDQLAALVAERGRGGDVYHARPWTRPLDPYSIGVGDSGAAKVIPRGGGVVRVLQVQHPYCDETSGLCTVHINVKDVDVARLFELGPNGKLVAHVSWWTGQSGGACDLDITGGAIFTVAGTNAVEIDVEQVSAYEGVALRAGDDLVVQAQAAWGGQSAPPRPAYMTGLIQTVVGGVANNSLAIPDHAQSMFLVSDTRGTTLEVDLLNLSATVAISHATFRVGEQMMAKIPIVAGMRWYNVAASANCKVFAIFEMVI